MRPQVTIIGGPNGSGKSTITRGLNQPLGLYVNADLIQREQGCDAITAAEKAKELRDSFLEERKDFTWESVLSSEFSLGTLRKAKDAGYCVRCIYVLTNDPEINVHRVLERNRNNGDDVPPEKVRKRYWRSLGNIPELLKLCDELIVYDNSPETDQGEPHRILTWQDGTMELSPCEAWSREMLESLVSGHPTQPV